MSDESTENNLNDRKWWAKALLVGAVVGLVALPVGALGARLGIWGFELGFMMLAVGVVLATIVFFVGIVAAVYANAKRLREERNSVLIGVAISVAILALMGNQFMLAQSVPPIHNISTDTDNPPQFEVLVTTREAQGANPLAYDSAKLAEVQRGAYPQVKPLISQIPQREMVGKAEAALEDMGLVIADSDPTRGHIEATDTTFWFGFKDDVVVRVRPEGSGSVVDVRSVSRVGQSDLGKNAARITDLLGRLEAG